MLELLIFDNEMLVYYPSGNPMKRIGKIADPETGEQVYDYALLSEFLQQLKPRLLRFFTPYYFRFIIKNCL